MKEILLKSLNTGLDMQNAIAAMLLSFVLGLIICGVYRVSSSGFSRSTSMSFAYLLTTMIITAILISLGNNIALSLGLIGSLSVIRFRTPIKDPEDMVYLFWSIATGLALGSGNFVFAVFTTALFSIIIYLFSKRALSGLLSSGYILVLECKDDETDNETIYKILSDHRIGWKLKSTLADKDAKQYEVVFELDHTKSETQIISAVAALKKLGWIGRVSLLSADNYSVV